MEPTYLATLAEELRRVIAAEAAGLTDDQETAALVLALAALDVRLAQVERGA